MKILLISPDHGNRINNFPWGVLSLGSYLTYVQKMDVILLDASSISKKEFKLKIKEIVPKVGLVGIGCFTTDVNFVKNLVDFIKGINANSKIILGGPHVILESEQTCRYKNIDFVAYGDGELTISYLIEELKKGKPNYNNVPGLIYKNDNRLKITEPYNFSEFYNTNYKLLPESTQQTFSQYIQVLTGRGCSYRCKFCYNSVIQQQYKDRDIHQIIQELSEIVKNYNPKVIYFRDEDFFQNRKRVKDFIQLYKENQFTFSWRATCRANYFNDRYLNEPLLKELENINCETLKMGIESGSQRVLNYIKKGIHINSVKRAVVEIAKRKGINGNYSFIAGFPGQSMKEHIDTIKLIQFILKQEPSATIIGPQYLRFYPGGLLYNEIINQYHFKTPKSFEEYSEKFCNKDQFGLYKNITYPWLPPNVKYIAMYGDHLIFLFNMSLKKLLSLKGLLYMPFSLMAKLRIRFNQYNYLYDLVIFSKLNNLYKRILLKIQALNSY